MLKKIIIIILVLIGITNSFLIIKNKSSEIESKQISNHGYKLAEETNKRLYNDVIISLFSPYTQKAVTNFYSKYLKETPGSDPNFDKVLSIKRVGDENRLDFLIKIETSPYIGPHNSVGRDHLTFRLNALGEVTLEKFEHIESSSILQQIYPDIIKKWPPS